MALVQRLSLILFLLCPLGAGAQNVADSGTEIVDRKLSELKKQFLDRNDESGFWHEIERMAAAGEYPLIDEIGESSQAPDNYVRLTFLHKLGEEVPDNVLLFANVNHVLAEELLFQRIADTSVYFKSIEVPSGVRFEYRILENDPLTSIFAGAKYGTRMHLLAGDPDPINRNKNTYPDGLSEGTDFVETWVELPGAAPQPYLADRGHPRGELIVAERESSLLGYAHKVFRYLPPGYDPEHAYPLVILLDGDAYFTWSSFQITLENLIAEGAIPPVLVLALNAGKKDGQTQRNDEFTCNPEFMDFMHKELIPWFTSQHKVAPDPADRIFAGSSFGGLFAAYFALNHPDVVGKVLSQSGSYHWGRDEDEVPYEWLVREFAFTDKKPVEFYMEVGALEGEYYWSGPNFPHQVISHRHFKTILDMKGYKYVYQEYAGGHEMLSWRGGIAEGLIHLLGAGAD